MKLDDIQFVFNRAISLTFVKKKLLFAFLILLLCGVLVVFFRGLAMHAGSWIAMSLTFLPIFVGTAILLAAGIFFTRVYHDEVKKLPVSYRGILANSWELMISVSYFSIPLILCYLLLWLALGLFVLLSEIPTIGEFFGVVLSFAPFLLNSSSLLLCIVSFFLLFFVPPVTGLKGLSRAYISKAILQRVYVDLFSNLLLCGIAAIPILAITGLLIVAAFLTDSVIDIPSRPIHVILQWFFVMFPFTAILTPAVVFFFNFSAESHVLLMKNLKDEG